MEDYKQETKFSKRIIYWIIGLMFVIAGIIWFFNRAEKVAENAFIHYEEFQEIYNSCEKINLDLCNMKELSDDDVMFQQFSKAQRINTLKSSLNRWTEEYNAKSKMWHRSMWKSDKLPYQLTTNQFNCY